MITTSPDSLDLSAQSQVESNQASAPNTLQPRLSQHGSQLHGPPRSRQVLRPTGSGNPAHGINSNLQNNLSNGFVSSPGSTHGSIQSLRNSCSNTTQSSTTQQNRVLINTASLRTSFTPSHKLSFISDNHGDDTDDDSNTSNQYDDYETSDESSIVDKPPVDNTTTKKATMDPVEVMAQRSPKSRRTIHPRTLVRIKAVQEKHKGDGKKMPIVYVSGTTETPLSTQFDPYKYPSPKDHPRGLNGEFIYDFSDTSSCFSMHTLSDYSLSPESYSSSSSLMFSTTMVNTTTLGYKSTRTRGSTRSSRQSLVGPNRSPPVEHTAAIIPRPEPRWAPVIDMNELEHDYGDPAFRSPTLDRGQFGTPPPELCQVEGSTPRGQTHLSHAFSLGASVTSDEPSPAADLQLRFERPTQSGNTISPPGSPQEFPTYAFVSPQPGKTPPGLLGHVHPHSPRSHLDTTMVVTDHAMGNLILTARPYTTNLSRNTSSGIPLNPNLPTHHNTTATRPMGIGNTPQMHISRTSLQYPTNYPDNTPLAYPPIPDPRQTAHLPHHRPDPTIPSPNSPNNVNITNHNLSPQSPRTTIDLHRHQAQLAQLNEANGFTYVVDPPRQFNPHQDAHGGLAQRSTRQNVPEMGIGNQSLLPANNTLYQHQQLQKQQQTILFDDQSANFRESYDGSNQTVNTNTSSAQAGWQPNYHHILNGNGLVSPPHPHNYHSNLSDSHPGELHVGGNIDNTRYNQQLTAPTPGPSRTLAGGGLNQQYAIPCAPKFNISIGAPNYPTTPVHSPLPPRCNIQVLQQQPPPQQQQQQHLLALHQQHRLSFSRKEEELKQLQKLQLQRQHQQSQQNQQQAMVYFTGTDVPQRSDIQQQVSSSSQNNPSPPSFFKQHLTSAPQPLQVPQQPYYPQSSHFQPLPTLDIQPVPLPRIFASPSD